MKFPWWRKEVESAPPVATRVPEPPAVRRNIGDVLFAWSAQKPEAVAPINPFAVPKAPPWVPKTSIIAMDDALTGDAGWAVSALSSTYGIGAGYVTFYGYPILAEMAQRPEYRTITEIISQDMTRKWIELQTVGKDKSEKLKLLTDALDRFKIRDRFREMMEHDGFFGKGHLYIDLGNSDDLQELRTSIGSGNDEASRAKIKKGSIKGFKTVEPIWVYPVSANYSNPLKPDFYRPQAWNVMGKEVHSSRILTVVGREVPDILKPSYMFGGLSMTQIAQPYVEDFIRTRQSVSDTVRSFASRWFKTNLADALNVDGGAGLMKRLMLLVNLGDNRNINVCDKDAEDFFTVSTPLGTLDRLAAQSQERMASIARIPLVKLLGITPSGLNASSDGEIRVYNDGLHAAQEQKYRIPLTTVIDLVQLNEFGEIDPEITFKFVPLWQLDEKELAEVNQIRATTDATLVEAGILREEESRRRLSNDPDSPYPGLDPDDLPEPPDADGAFEDAPGQEGKPNDVEGERPGADVPPA